MASPGADEERCWEALAFEPARPVSVRHLEERFAVGALAERAARALLLPPRAASSAAIVACELAENLVQHAGGGRVYVERHAGERLVRIVAEDRGPPFKDLERAFADGSTDLAPIPPEKLFGRIGFGGGLGTVRRLAQLVVVVCDETEKRIAAYVGARAGALGELAQLIVRPR